MASTVVCFPRLLSIYLRFAAIDAGATPPWSLDADLKGRFRENGFKNSCLQKGFRCGSLERLGWADTRRWAVLIACDFTANAPPHRRIAARQLRAHFDKCCTSRQRLFFRGPPK
jgi:hypothetical protein